MGCNAGEHCQQKGGVRKVGMLRPGRVSVRCELITATPPSVRLRYPCSSRNFVTSGDQIGMASGEPIKKCPSLPNGGTT